jgi:hypothetical protein
LCGSGGAVTPSGGTATAPAAGGGCSCAMNGADGGFDPRLLALLGLMVMPLIWKRFRKV